MKYEIQPAKHESIFPALRRLNPATASYDGEVVVLFLDKCHGYVIASENPRRPVGYYSTSWVTIEDYHTWLPCSITLTS